MAWSSCCRSACCRSHRSRRLLLQGPSSGWCRRSRHPWDPPPELSPLTSATCSTALDLATWLDVLVTLRAQADPLRTPDVGGARNRRSVIRTLRSTARSAQANLLRALYRWQVRGDVRRIRPLWIVDAVAVRVRARLVDAIAETPGVAHVELDRSSAVPTSVPTGAPEAGVVTIGAPTLWDLGLTGAGVVVANMDTGVDVDHPDLSASWRGGTNSWFDPSGQHPSIPTDLSGHGTETMGIMVGRDAGGSTIGVAPDATWIAAKIFNDAGSANTSGIHAAFQWMLDPDGNVLTDDAPDVVEGSWSMGSPGCDLTYEPDLQALRAVGILPVFAAGNGGPSVDTSMSPGNNPSALAVGAVDDADVISSISSRGPSTCGGSTEVFPDVVAPGEDVHTADSVRRPTSTHPGPRCRRRTWPAASLCCCRRSPARRLPIRDRPSRPQGWTSGPPAPTTRTGTAASISRPHTPGSSRTRSRRHRRHCSRSGRTELAPSANSRAFAMKTS